MTGQAQGILTWKSEKKKKQTSMNGPKNESALCPVSLSMPLQQDAMEVGSSAAGQWSSRL